MTQFPASIIYTIYYRKDHKAYRIREGRKWTEITLDQLEAEVKKHVLNAEKYMNVHDHNLLNKMDYWTAFAEQINTDELEFWFTYGLLTEEEYLYYIYIASE